MKTLKIEDLSKNFGTTEVLKKQFADIEDDIIFEQLNNTGFNIYEFETRQNKIY